MAGMTTRPSARRRSLDARLGLRQEGAQRAPGAGPIMTMPGVVGVLIALMVGVFVLGFLPDPFGPMSLGRRIDYVLGFIPARFAAGLVGQASLTETLVPVVGHVFVHGNLGHLLLNVLWLAVFGTGVARRLVIEGGRLGAPSGTRAANTLVFLGFFLACGVAGALFYGALNPGSRVLLVGASGAISGLMAAAMRFALRPFAPFGPAYGPLASARSRPVLAASGVYIGFNLLTALGFGGLFGTGLDIAWEAHIGGYLFGLYAFPLFDGLARRPVPAERFGA